MVKVMKFDPAHFLRTREEMVDFLDEAAKDDDPAMFAQSMQVVWRALAEHGFIGKNERIDDDIATADTDNNNDSNTKGSRKTDTPIAV